MKILALALFLLAITSCLAAPISVPTPDSIPDFQPSPTGERIAIDGYATISSPGDPALPFIETCLLIPPDTDPQSVTASMSGATTTRIPGSHDIAPAPPIATSTDNGIDLDWGTSATITRGRNTRVYQANQFYPRSNVELVDIGSLRKWRIARVRFYPYRYNPVTRQLRLTTGGHILLSIANKATSGPFTAQSAAPYVPHLSDSVFSEKVAQLTANFSEARSWYAPPSGPTLMSSEAVTSAISDYVIITTAAIASGSAKLQAFAAHKASRGFSPAIVTEAQWGGGTGDTAANNIRNYLKANYVSKAIKYVLLIGGPAPANGTVPMKMLWPRHNYTSYQEAPSDYYYADLTGNWDRDGDGYFGEGDNDFGAGGIDRYPEVIVGRIPFYGSYADLDSILQKTMDYEAGVTGGNWVRNALLTAKPSDSNTPGYQLFEAIKKDAIDPAGFTATKVYEQSYGLSPAPDYTPCTYDTVQSAWQQHAGFHFWWTHGSETTAVNVTSPDRAALLDNRYPSFTFQCSCLNASPEYSNNLAYSLLKNGAIATDAATRVSWYYPGQVVYTNTDSNAGMTYRYALKLIRDHMPCGDAHYAMMVETPNDIWMNHCVFNIYGDPSVAYASGPTIAHTPYPNTDVTTGYYNIDAQITSNGAFKSGSPAVKWNTNGSQTFTSASMTVVSGNSYRAQIPAKPVGTTIYYYIQAEDTLSRMGTSPSGAPSALYSFQIRSDAQSPVITHTPLASTGDTTGPYTVTATVTDNTGVQGVTLYYHKNGAADTAIQMTSLGNNSYQAQIPGPTASGDVISYYISAVDSSLSHNSSRSPSPSGYNTFSIVAKKRVAVFNCTTVPPYFSGGNSNAYQLVSDLLNADPGKRFQVTVLTSLTAANLSGQDSLVLPDNAVLSADMQSVASWFVSGKTILTLESSTSYAACSGLLWPQAAGTSGSGTYWNANASQTDQEIVLADPITAGYSLGQVIDSRGYCAQFPISMLPSDAKVLSRSKYNPSYAYAVYKDVPGAGRFVAFGPFIPIQQSQYSMIREAVMGAPSGKSLQITAPTAGAVFNVGQSVPISFQLSGAWLGSDRMKLEYTNGTDSVWRAISGAESLLCQSGVFTWNTTGLTGSRNYRVRATQVNGSIAAQSGAFTIVPVMSISQAKSCADGTLVKLVDKIAISNANGYTYVQEPSRLAGIKVRTSQALTVGSLTTVVGTMNTVNGERTIDTDLALSLGVSSPATPLFLRTSALGGATFGGQQGVMEYRGGALVPATGLNNIGILVRVAGTVTSVGSDYFYVDDGANCSDGSGARGVRVLCGSFGKPASGARAVVDGVSSTYYDRANLWRALALPTQNSVLVLQ